MASPNIRIKRSAIAGKVPHYPSTLELGEFAINTADGKVFIAAGVGAGITVREVGISTNRILSGIATIATLGASNLTVENTIAGISSGSLKVDTAVDSGNQWHHVGFLDNRTGYQKIKTNGLTYNPSTGRLYAGIGSFGTITSNAGIDVTGNITVSGTVDGVDVAALSSTVAGIDTSGFPSGTIPTNNNQLTNGAGFITNSVSGDLTLTDTATDNSAGPEFVLYRNSSSPAAADYLGQIKFQGESSTGANRLYAKITGKIGDPTNGSEDGIIEIAHRKNGSNNISGRWNQDNLLLINGTGLSVAGDITAESDLDVTGDVTAASFIGDGSGLTNLQVGAATSIACGVTTATQGQTSFSSPHAHNDGTTQHTVETYINGVRQRNNIDFNTSSTSTVTLTSGATVGDEVSIQVHYGHTLDQESFTGTQGQTDFTISGDFAASKNFKVFLNGVKLRKTADYTTSASIVLTTGCKVGDEVDICGDTSEDQFTATEGQTTFTPTDSNISSKNSQVFLNGVLLRPSDWVFGDTTVSLTNGATVGDEIDVVVRRN